jgi:Lrp/AsnC family transcriptional regulator
MSRQIDSFDKRILAELQKDATVSLDSLAERIALSRNACWRRIQKLEEAGVIRGRVALLDPDALNLGLAVLIQVRTSQHNAEWAARFRAALRDIPEIIAAYRTAGDIDYILHARIPDMRAYDRLYQKLIARIEMDDVSASFVMEEIKQSSELPLQFA